MSFLDLATLALHRRNEMGARINLFVSKCDVAINDIKKLKMQAHNFVNQLNCEPSELKERFLTCMKQLDEYMYLVTDFNLSVAKLADTGSMEYTPVLDTSSKVLPAPLLPSYNIIDMLSEPMPSTSIACTNFCPIEKPLRNRVPKEEQTLIAFSSSSCSSESVPKIDMLVKKEKEVQCELAAGVNNMNLRDSTSPELSVPAIEVCNLPAQVLLETDRMYDALIMNSDGVSFWVITDKTEEVFSLMTEMTTYYKERRVPMSLEDVKALVYCAVYDSESDCYYRGFFLRLIEESEYTAEIYLVDTGETRTTSCACEVLQPLVPQFCAKPPYARVCHLAGVEFVNEDDRECLEKQEFIMKQYVGTHCTIEVDDNTSESLGVFVLLPKNEILNQIMVQQGLAILTLESSEASQSASQDHHLPPDNQSRLKKTPPPPTHGPPELVPISNSQLDITNCAEYDDPVEAVTGYSCRDEADICKHYKGGPDKTCFKGTRCKKKHILKHPDGWTLDRVEVPGKCGTMHLPAPGTWHKVHVTNVCHFDRLFVQLVKEKGKEELPCFGVVLPPSSLESLIRDMNSPASRMSYKSITMTPATGELVAALYPPDNQWYRARVLTVTRADQNLEVRYIDYGNVVWVKEDAIRILEPRYTVLPEQAVQCALAGVRARTHDSRQWAESKHRLGTMVQDRTLDAHIIARDYDELTVELFDEQGYSIAEQLAAANLIHLTEYEVIDDSTTKQKQAVP